MILNNANNNLFNSVYCFNNNSEKIIDSNDKINDDNFDEDLYEEGMQNYDQQYYINPNYNVYEYERNLNMEDGNLRKDG